METKEQLNQMQVLMEQLVKMVGHNNAVTEELVGRMDRMEVRFDRLEEKVDRVESRLDRLENRFDRLEEKVDKLEFRMGALEAQTTSGFADVVHMVTVLGQKVDKMETAQLLHTEMLRKLTADYAQHEAEILLLKRAR
jgi:predicted nuclease with TOPRIM domain